MCLFLLLPALGGPLLMSAKASAQNTDIRSPQRRSGLQAQRAKAAQSLSSRYLGGHYFLKSALVDIPFIAPYVSSSLEGAFATLHIADAESDIKAAGLTPSFSGQFHIANAVGIELGAGFSEIIGADDYSALVLGANFSYAISATLRVPIIREEQWMLTTMLKFAPKHGTSFSPLVAVANEITTKAQSSNFLISTSTSHIEPGLLAAVTLSPVFGLSAELSRIFATTTTTPGGDQTDDGTVRTGLALSSNLRPLLAIPIGLTAAYRNDWPTRSGVEATPMYEFGIFEMLRPNFNFGAEMTRLMTSTPTISVLLSLTYYY
ncbi:MAG: hypothetical protein A2Z97_01110 [Bdellovibrionales bacterium GWB1_52_6]|nr:MAG: hypothetical protein A2Z97_01110 [Bdellovibrionales bacterium GWB1_52_6]HCM38921.1 hypothetical protein [Bdellovibrionales bacterium]